MTSCIALFGLPGNGKTYASKILAKHFDLKLIPFDEIINIISEYVREKVGGSKSIIDFDGESYPKIFESIEEFGKFTADLDKLISNNMKFFEKLYKESIENKKPIINYESGFNPSAIKLGKIGDSLEHFADEILQMMMKCLVKDSQMFIIEGFYFNSENNFRKKLEQLCDIVSYLGCFYRNKDLPYSYKYNGKKFDDLESIKEIISKEMEECQKSDSTQTKSEKEITLYEIETLLIKLYNKNVFYRKMFHLGYKILSKLVRK